MRHRSQCRTGKRFAIFGNATQTNRTISNSDVQFFFLYKRSSNFAGKYLPPAALLNTWQPPQRIAQHRRDIAHGFWYFGDAACQTPRACSYASVEKPYSQFGVSKHISEAVVAAR